MSKTHTPGPWQTYINGKVVEVLGPEKQNSKPVVSWMGFDGCNRPLTEQRANARLIAAAPDLLAALQELVGEVTISRFAEEIDYDVLERVWAVIDRAQGMKATRPLP